MDEADVPAEGAATASSRHLAFLEATMPHLDAVHRVARHASRDPHLAEDLVQETYLRAYAAFDTLRGSTRSWLVAICLNLVRSEWRRRARRPNEQLFSSMDDPDRGGGQSSEVTDRLWRSRASESDEVFTAVQANLSAQLVTRALAELPDEQRLTLVLMDLAGHTASEVAELLSCPRGTVLSRAHRGRRRLAQLLAERGVGP
jgi:RNA polymerase sigma-70 factor (ECF subfamily)